MDAPLPRLMKRLADRGFCTKEGQPTPKTGWMFLDADQIVNLYSGVKRGLQNYAGKEGQKDRQVSFYLNPDWNKKRDGFQRGKQTDIDLVQTMIRLKTRSELGRGCCICESAEQIVMHHVRHIRKLSHKREATGFNRLLRAINRKQIPVCATCHGKIPKGKVENCTMQPFPNAKTPTSMQGSRSATTINKTICPRSNKNGENPGSPRFVGRNRYESFTYPDGAGWKLINLLRSA